MGVQILRAPSVFDILGPQVPHSEKSTLRDFSEEMRNISILENEYKRSISSTSGRPWASVFQLLGPTNAAQGP